LRALGIAPNKASAPATGACSEPFRATALWTRRSDDPEAAVLSVLAKTRGMQVEGRSQAICAAVTPLQDSQLTG